MPVSITKNKVSEQCIEQMVCKAFPQEKIKNIIELTEGFFNVAFQVSLEKRDVILKIAPPPDAIVMTHEKDIMQSEVRAMKMIEEQSIVPVPRVLFYDRGREICKSDYFFMEKLEGSSFSNIADKIAQEEKDKVFFQMGKYTKAINSIENDIFGYFGQKEKQGSNWYEVFRSMVMDTYSDAKRKNISIPVSEEQILSMLKADKEIFEEVKKAKFVHWDIWAGNVFVENKTVTGIIDFERCLWADELMEVGFRTYGLEKAFFKGYGIEELSDKQLKRAKWYDIYLFLIACLECDYRMYDNKGMYEWGSEMLKKSIHEKSRW
ncbi:phosphotransferase family enzyme [Kineothrix alysoides]|uniref:Phosphotransferase family enzyme n=1 Tax=Kineothrix alysoides TaxID=1469948 RepID=A0A4R1QUQ1_9FIRM|nr:aminoglycoside phosphotransferase family protein [Kineothrix alysoides]TCL57257.1 phosphotransferase family enzyme [Kineothrix alysoides]